MSASMPERRVQRAPRIEAEAQVPVAVVGGGACGLVAALMLHDQGIACVVLPCPSGASTLRSNLGRWPMRA